MVPRFVVTHPLHGAPAQAHHHWNVTTGVTDMSIIREGVRHWIARTGNGRYEVMRYRATHSVVCARVSFPDKPEYAEARAIAEFERREASPVECARY